MLFSFTNENLVRKNIGDQSKPWRGVLHVPVFFSVAGLLLRWSYCSVLRKNHAEEDLNILRKKRRNFTHEEWLYPLLVYQI